MSFTVYGETPGSGDHWEFGRDTAAGAVFKAADLMRDGWTGVHILDEQNQIYWPDRFHLVSKSNTKRRLCAPVSSHRLESEYVDTCGSQICPVIHSTAHVSLHF